MWSKRRARYHGLTGMAGDPHAALPLGQLCEGETCGFLLWKARESVLSIFLLQAGHTNQTSSDLQPPWGARAAPQPRLAQAPQNDWRSQTRRPDHQPHSTKLKSQRDKHLVSKQLTKWGEAFVFPTPQTNASLPKAFCPGEISSVAGELWKRRVTETDKVLSEAINNTGKPTQQRHPHISGHWMWAHLSAAPQRVKLRLREATRFVTKKLAVDLRLKPVFPDSLPSALPARTLWTPRLSLKWSLLVLCLALPYRSLLLKLDAFGSLVLCWQAWSGPASEIQTKTLLGHDSKARSTCQRSTPLLLFIPLR